MPPADSPFPSIGDQSPPASQLPGDIQQPSSQGPMSFGGDSGDSGASPNGNTSPNTIGGSMKQLPFTN